MKKLIYLCMFLFLFISTFATAWMSPVVIGGGSSDPCSDAGCTGTYELCWTGQYSGDTDKACLDSGANMADGTADAGVIVDVGAGDYQAKINAADEGVTWDLTSNTLPAEGTIQCKVTVPADPSSDYVMFGLVVTKASGDSNHIMLYHSAGILYGRYEGGGTSQINGGPSLVTGATRTYSYTWKADSGDKHCCAVTAAGVKAEAADYTTGGCDTETLTDIASIDGFDIGEVHRTEGTVSANGDYCIECEVREGYEGP